jgi:hypothetical protein
MPLPSVKTLGYSLLLPYEKPTLWFDVVRKKMRRRIVMHYYLRDES